MNAYHPERGDVVWLDHDPHRGHEQAGKRPAIVLSPAAYNQRVGLALFFPITSQVKGYPFEVPIRLANLDGVVLADQIKSLDWRARGIQFIEAAPPEVLDEVRAKLKRLIE